MQSSSQISDRHHQQTNTQFFTGQMPFLLPNQQCQSTEGYKGISAINCMTVSQDLHWVGLLCAKAAVL